MTTRPEPGVWDWTRTVRFRLTVTYSSLLFGLAALVVTTLYVAVRLRQPPATAQGVLPVDRIRTSEGIVTFAEPLRLADVRAIERAAHDQTLEALRAYSLSALAALFLASLLIGWWLSGRALRPVEEITRTAADITATDLSRRIALGGPDDELRRLADTIDDMLARLDEAFAAQRRMMDDASHELRTPLAVIRANVDAILGDDEAPPAVRRQAVDTVTDAVERMARLVDDLLATARQAGVAVPREVVSLADIGRDALDEAALLAPDRHLRSGLADGVPVVGDRDALRRAVSNLLANAVRYSPTGSEVLCACGRTGDWAWLAVRDRGPGLPHGVGERVFDRFYRIEGHSAPATSAGREGAGADGARHAGLGLAIVRQIVESHRGAVRVHSEPGRGATFVLWLPAADPLGVVGPGAAPAEDPLARSTR